MDIIPYLKLMAEKNASDLFFCTGVAVTMKIEGVMRAVGSETLAVGVAHQVANSVMTDEQIQEFEKTLEMNFAMPLKGVGRFRFNIFRQRGEVSLVVRYINMHIPRIEEMNLPNILEDLIMIKRGLVLVVGATGSGKSTSLAAMIGHRNRTQASHILTIEDPLEFVHQHARSIVQQREVGIDTHSYANALKNAMREAPDVILIGEIRDLATMRHAIAYAETGHLCLATLHSNNANQALDRIINFYPETARDQLLIDLSLNLRAIVSQRLVFGKDGLRLPAVEVMLNTPYIEELIEKGDLTAIKGAMKESTDEGVVTFDQALLALFQSGKITLEEALANADSKNDLSLLVRMGENKNKSSSTTSASTKEASELLF